MKRDATSSTTKIGMAALGAAAAWIATAALAPAAQAAPADDVPSVVIKYDANQAATERGALELYARLVYAARQVCPSDDTGNLARVALARQCQKDAVARAVNQIHERRLVEIAAARSSRG
ncbi:MAG: UrcA family protein [Steroidobacterales bacterium]